MHRIGSLAVLVVVAAALPGVAHADPYGMAGCGLGSIFFKDKPGFVQVLAATTNGSTANQTFGITTGTSNCTSGGTVKKEAEAQAFLEINYAQLSRDAAAGGGEYLTAFGTLLGCSADVQAQLGTVLQAGHESLFSSANPAEVLAGVKAAVAQDGTLAQSCNRI